MAAVVKPYTFAAGAAAYAEHVNSNFDQVTATINGDLDLANLRDEAFITSFNFHHAGLIPASGGTARKFLFSWPTLNSG
mgnify:CR=1 FL=1